MLVLAALQLCLFPPFSKTRLPVVVIGDEIPSEQPTVGAGQGRSPLVTWVHIILSSHGQGWSRGAMWIGTQLGLWVKG